MQIEYRKISELIPYARNARTHSDEQVQEIVASMRKFGFTNPVLVTGDGLVAGHGRTLAAFLAGPLRWADGTAIPEGTVPTLNCTDWTDEQRRAYILADNKLALKAGWDVEVLAKELTELGELDFDLGLIGFESHELDALLSGDFEDLPATSFAGEAVKNSGEAYVPPAEREPQEIEGNTEDRDEAKGNLASRFLIPPFSVLNAREGWWQDRKRTWLAMGIKSEEGRDAKAFGHAGATDEVSLKILAQQDGISIFDPVLCEVLYTWFSPPGGTVLDPFAGGSVRGIVAAKLGRQYVGGELRPEQVAANRMQAADICGADEGMPAWIEGDSRNIDKTCAGVQADFVFSCPPYADLEVYSDDPADLSTLGYADFVAAYREIIAKACALLKPNRFACFVVGEVRDKKGNYYDFVGDTVQAFRDAGLHFYNEAILVTAVGSLPIRAGKQFASGRKLGKTHQNILVFVKGDGKKAATDCGEVEVYLPENNNEPA